MREPMEQDEWSTLEAELRRATRHRSAAYEQMLETQREVQALMARAQELLAKVKSEEAKEEEEKP